VPYGNEKANTDFTRLRAQVVIDGLVANGVMASRIQRREIGSVKFQSDPQESRRVEIIVGKPRPDSAINLFIPPTSKSSPG
jgi:outer membrane protein OmpA-like peptidoglycan-associated protein